MSEDNEEKGIFLKFLEENPRSAVDIVKHKRERFKVLMHALTKSFLLDKYDKSWRLCGYLLAMLEDDGNEDDCAYPDEYIECPLDDVLVYLKILYAVSAAQISRYPEECMQICVEHLSLVHLYPVLYPTLVVCYLKLGKFKLAKETVLRGIYFVIHKLQPTAPNQNDYVQLPGLCILKCVLTSGINKPVYTLLQLYAYARIMGIHVDNIVAGFMEKAETTAYFDLLKGSIDQMPFKCCLGGRVEVLDEIKQLVTLKYMQVVPDYLEAIWGQVNLFNGNFIDYHIENHCCIRKVIVHDYETNINAVIKYNIAKRSQVNSLCDLQVNKHLIKYKVSSIRRLPTYPQVFPCYSSNHRLVWQMSKPYQTVFRPALTLAIKNCGVKHGQKHIFRRFLCKTILPEVRFLNEYVRINIVNGLYRHLIRHQLSACKVLPGLENVACRMGYLYHEYAVPLAKRGHLMEAYTFLCPMMKAIRTCLNELTEYVHTYNESQGIRILYKKLKVAESQYNKLWSSVHEALKTAHGRLLLEEIPMHQQCYCHVCFYSQQVYWQRENSTLAAPSEGSRAQAKLRAKAAAEAHRACNNNNAIAASASCSKKTKYCNKETQTKYHKFSCTSKQTQTDKRLGETAENALKKQISTLTATIDVKTNKIAELEDEVYQFHEAHNEMVQNENKMIKSLKRELAEKSEEFRIQMKHIKANINRNMEWENVESHHKKNEKLLKDNEKFVNENKSLQTQLRQVAQERDAIKENFDKLAKEKELVDRMLEKSRVDFQELFESSNKLKTDWANRLQKEQNKTHELSTLIVTSVRELIDALIEKMGQYKLRCQRMHHELSCFVTITAVNLSIKQTCDNNQTFLATTVAQIERNLQLLVSLKAAIVKDPLRCSLNAKPILVYADEYCTAMFNQYVLNLNSMMNIENTMANVFVNLGQAGSQVGYAPNPGPVGANRPQSSATPSRRQSSSEIVDLNTKSILSQIANAVNYPSSMSPTYNLKPSQGAVRRTPPSPLDAYWPPPQPPPSPTPDCADFNASNGKYRELFHVIKTRFPSALTSDLIDALNYIKAMHNDNLYIFSADTLCTLVGNYLHQYKNRMAKPELDAAKEETCPICFEVLSALPASTLKCHHIFHTDCIRSWIRYNNVCPICRKFTILEKD